ncbi:MAG: acyl-CoA dehydrogenase family protein [Sulfitobacter sp.]
MDFNLSEDHQMLSDSLRRFLAEASPVESRNKTAYSAPFHAPALYAQLAELGVIGAFVSEEQGGFGGSAEDVSVIFEELGRALCVEPVLGSLLSLRLLAATGQSALAEQMIAGEMRGAFAFAEPDVSADLSCITAKAEKSGDVWRLTGRKSAVYGAPGADFVLVAAQSGAGLGLYLVQAPDLIAAGMVDGGGIADLVLEGTKAQCLGTDCAALIEETLDLGRIALCAEAVGAADHLVEITRDYLTQRQQFGRPISSFQALQHRVVDMLVELEQCRSITISAVAHFASPLRAKHAAMAKNLIGRMASKIAEESIQLHGGIGMTWEYPGAHYAKRLIMIDHQLGDHHDHIARLCSGTLEGAPA